MKSLFSIIPVIVLSSVIVYSQAVTTGVPFLLISPSTEANGMGGIMGSGTPTSSSSMMSNPAQLGMMSREYTFSSDFYRTHTLWLPSFNLSDLWFNSFSAMYGQQLDEVTSLKPSIGFGFSRVYLNLGEFVRTDERGNELGRFVGYEYSNNYTLGGSVDFGIQSAFGITVKQIVSHLSVLGTAGEAGNGEARIAAMDIGIAFKAPLYDLLFGKKSDAAIFPFTDISLAYALNNLGGNISYIDANQSDPLPRLARVGWSFETGFDVAFKNEPFNFFRITIAREAEDLLVGRDTSSSWYKGLNEDLDVYRSMVEIENYGNVSIRRGFSISMLETFTYREGSYAWDGNLIYKTNGTSISTRGVFHAIGRTISDENGFNLTKYILEHFEIRVSESEYTGHELLGNTNFKNIVFAFHQ